MTADESTRLHESVALALCGMAKIEPDDIRVGDTWIVRLMQLGRAPIRVAIKRNDETGQLYTCTLTLDTSKEHTRT